jgi:hypothetical protein
MTDRWYAVKKVDVLAADSAWQVSSEASRSGKSKAAVIQELAGTAPTQSLSRAEEVLREVRAAAAVVQRPVPVTVLSGFLGP